MNFFKKLLGFSEPKTDSTLVQAAEILIMVETLRSLPLNTLNFLAYIMGLAFGPEGARHFSTLSTQEQADLLNRVPVLRTNHADWPKVMQWVPRTVTTWVIDEQPKILAGNTADPKPIPSRGEWFVTKGYFAMTTEEGVHIRLGFRYDDVDHYINFPSFTIKRY